MGGFSPAFAGAGAGGMGISSRGGSRAADGLNGRYTLYNADNGGNTGVETGGQGGIINEETITNKEQTAK